MAALHWISEGEHSYFAEGALGRHGIAQLLVECLGGAAGWEWRVWDAVGQLLPHCGGANSPEEAKERADKTALMVGMLRLASRLRIALGSPEAAAPPKLSVVA